MDIFTISQMTPGPIGIIMLIATFIAVRLKVSVIKLLAGSGVCGLLLGMMGKFF